jgi:hypothetical protein
VAAYLSLSEEEKNLDAKSSVVISCLPFSCLVFFCSQFFCQWPPGNKLHPRATNKGASSYSLTACVKGRSTFSARPPCVVR